MYSYVLYYNIEKSGFSAVSASLVNAWNEEQKLLIDLLSIV